VWKIQKVSFTLNENSCEKLRFWAQEASRRFAETFVISPLSEKQPSEFSLSHVYQHCQAPLHAAYPDNSNIQAKIRQQLQELRAIDLLEFVGRGRYKRLWDLD
jgi:hypothetical protein